MGKRRAHGEGTIYQRASDNRWAAQITDPASGKRKSVYGKTRGEVVTKLRRVQGELERGLPMVEERQTVAQYLTTWLETMRPPQLVQESWEGYETHCRLHIIPIIGNVRLAHLSPQRIQHLYALWAAEGLSSSSVRQIHAIVHRALDAALRLGLIARNVADLIEKPRAHRVDIRPLSAEQARDYLAAAEQRGERLRTLFALALATGMRLGELRALRWSDVQLGGKHGASLQVNATLKVRGADRQWTRVPPKTHRSRRQIALDPTVATALRAHRARQHEERLLAGPAWAGGAATPGDELVFTTALGNPLSPQMVRTVHKHLLHTAALPQTTRLHDLRHTAATLALLSNVNPKVVSEMLGHSAVGITLDIYSHVVPSMQQNAAAAVAGVLWPAALAE